MFRILQIIDGLPRIPYLGRQLTIIYFPYLIHKLDLKL